jgi:Fe-S-cluster containining protein
MNPARRRPGGKGKAAASARTVTGDDLEARRLVRLRTTELMRSRRTPLQVVEAAREAAGLADGAIRDALQREPPERPLACKEGCAWCCYRRVGVAVPEVAAIAAYLQEHLSAAELAQTRQRVVEADERRRELGIGSWAASRLPCPLLANNRCQAYPVRPLTCRGFTSSAATACEQWVTSTNSVRIPVHVPSQRLTTMALDGLRAGLAEAGLPGEHLDLTPALRVILSTPGALQEWLEGRSPFRSAVML